MLLLISCENALQTYIGQFNLRCQRLANTKTVLGRCLEFVCMYFLTFRYAKRNEIKALRNTRLCDGNLARTPRTQHRAFHLAGNHLQGSETKALETAVTMLRIPVSICKETGLQGAIYSAENQEYPPSPHNPLVHWGPQAILRT